MMENLKGKERMIIGLLGIMRKGAYIRLFSFLEVRKEEMKSILEPHVFVCIEVHMCACEHSHVRVWDSTGACILGSV